MKKLVIKSENIWNYQVNDSNPVWFVVLDIDEKNSRKVGGWRALTSDGPKRDKLSVRMHIL